MELGSATITPSIERFETLENVTGQGAIGASGIKRSSYAVSLAIRSVKPSHLAKVLHSAVTVKSAGGVTDEAGVAKVEEMIAACKSNKVQYMDGIMFIHSARLPKIRELLDNPANIRRK